MFVLVSYDIQDNKIRRTIAKHLLNYGARVQKSVFECNVDQNQYKEIIEGLRDISDKARDSIRVYRLCAGCYERISISGWGDVTEDEDFHII